MLTELVRRWSRVVLEPTARFVSRMGISPNLITVIGFLLMVGVAYVISLGHLQLGGLLIMATAVFDAIDGTLARLVGRTSRFGAFLDSTLDRFSEAVIYLGLFVHLIGTDATLELVLIYATIVGSLMVSYARARAEGIGVPLKEGLFTRFERVGLLVVGLIFNQLTIALWLLAIFSNFTAIQRMWLVWRITGGERGG
jgi:CDP-diacylglycerol---glycerol-3-phosphate 3-phosphatidyltransferase